MARFINSVYSFEIKILSSDENSERDLQERFLQSPFWASFKAMHGWTAKRFAVSAMSDSGEKIQCTVCVLLRVFRFAFINFSLGYIPLAPEFSIFAEKSAESELKRLEKYCAFLVEFEKAVKKILPSNLLFLRYDLPVDFSTCQERDFCVSSIKKLALANKLPLKKAFTDIQPPDTTVLDLTKSKEDLLSAMKPKWRYNIRLAEKKGVCVKFFTAHSPDFEKALDVFYELYETTARRDGIAIHAKSYYSDLLKLSENYKNAPEVRLYIAENEGDSLAAIITLFCKKEAVYLYGASSNVKRNLMPAYLLQWVAINDAKAHGSALYDFYGIPPVEDENHPMHGLFRFKTGFGGKIIHRPGCVDVPVKFFYSFYCLAEHLRAFFHKKIKKILAGR